MKLAILASLVFLTACASKAPNEKDFTGFISDYSNLEPVELSSGAKILRWVHPDIKNRGYDSLILEEVGFYPKPQVQDRLSQSAIDGLADHLNQTLQDIVSQNNITTTDVNGKHTLRFRSAITSIGIKAEDFRARDLIPLKLLIKGATLALAEEDYEVTIAYEFEMIDSVTQEVMVKAIRKGRTLNLSDREENFSIEHAEQMLKTWGVDMNAGLEQFSKMLN